MEHSLVDQGSLAEGQARRRKEQPIRFHQEEDGSRLQPPGRGHGAWHSPSESKFGRYPLRYLQLVRVIPRADCYLNEQTKVIQTPMIESHLEEDLPILELDRLSLLE